MAVVVVRAVGVSDEVPADQVVRIRGGAVLGRAAGPAAGTGRGDHVSPGDHAVVAAVHDLPRPLVDRVVQIAEGDQAVAVDVGQLAAHAGGDLGLVEPEVSDQVGMVVVDAGIHI